MVNAAAAGPSRGLLDVLFGSGESEASEADGQGFLPLMNLIKALKEKNEEDASTEIGRTDTGTKPGVGAIEYRPDEIPGLLAEANAGKVSQQKLEQDKDAISRLAMLYGMQQAQAQQQQVQGPMPIPSVELDEVNRILKEKSLPPLSHQETSLLDSVNQKIGQANQNPILNGMPKAEEAAQMDKATQPKAEALGALFSKELAQRGVDAKAIKSAETKAQSVAPEKMLHTDTYLQMHESFAKGAPKENGLDMNSSKKLLQEDGNISPLKSQESLTKAAVQQNAEDAGKKDLFGRSDSGSGDPIDLKDRKLPQAQGIAFAEGLTQSLKGSSDPLIRDVYLQGTNPNEMRETLLGEIGQGVSAQALRGGGEMKIVIHPEDLGEVKIKVSTRQGKVEVQMVSENEEVAKLIRSGSQDLDSSLRDQNLTLAKFEVTVSADGNVSSIDAKGNLTDQFLSQNSQNGFSQGAGGDDSRFARWNGSQQGQDNSPRFGSMSSEDSGRPAAASAKATPKSQARDSSRRLDVVA